VWYCHNHRWMQSSKEGTEATRRGSYGERRALQRVRIDRCHRCIIHVHHSCARCTASSRHTLHSCESHQRRKKRNSNLHNLFIYYHCGLSNRLRPTSAFHLFICPTLSSNHNPYYYYVHYSTPILCSGVLHDGHRGQAGFTGALQVVHVDPNPKSCRCRVSSSGRPVPSTACCRAIISPLGAASPAPRVDSIAPGTCGLCAACCLAIISPLGAASAAPWGDSIAPGTCGLCSGVLHDGHRGQAGFTGALQVVHVDLNPKSCRCRVSSSGRPAPSTACCRAIISPLGAASPAPRVDSIAPGTCVSRCPKSPWTWRVGASDEVAGVLQPGHRSHVLFIGALQLEQNVISVT
jgi:hypothetical protein